MKEQIQPFLARHLLVLALSAGCLGLTGCATVDPDESDIPWNAPQSWEGSPSIPGFSGDGR